MPRKVCSVATSRLTPPITPADVVREPAVRVRDVRPALHHQDLGLFVQPPQARCTRRATRHSADDDDLHAPSPPSWWSTELVLRPFRAARALDQLEPLRGGHIVESQLGRAAREARWRRECGDRPPSAGGPRGPPRTPTSRPARSPGPVPAPRRCGRPAPGLGQQRPLDGAEDLQHLGAAVRRGQDRERSDDHGVSSRCFTLRTARFVPTRARAPPCRTNSLGRSNLGAFLRQGQASWRSAGRATCRLAVGVATLVDPFSAASRADSSPLAEARLAVELRQQGQHQQRGCGGRGHRCPRRGRSRRGPRSRLALPAEAVENASTVLPVSVPSVMART